jgi:hypothetical protein
MRGEASAVERCVASGTRRSRSPRRLRRCHATKCSGEGGTRVARPKRTPRIATAFKDGATSDDVSILIVDVGDASSVANECAERARELLPPCLRPDEIEGQSRAMGDASFAQLYPTFAGKLADLLPRIEANYREVA